ncbi:Hypothetical protein D9617_8g048940 [Elsinoe fawcettii]|nr:Hypothetical protein D9617_8g048940 [Elsinoe fawcettii]
MTDYYTTFSTPDVARLMSTHIESFGSSGFGEGDAMLDTFGRNTIQSFLQNDTRSPLQPFARDPAVLEHLRDRFGGQDGFVVPLMWYRAYTEQHHYEAERTSPESAERVEVPMLVVTGQQDPVAPLVLWEQDTVRGIFADLETRALGVGHFLPQEVPGEFAGVIVEWLRRKGLVWRDSVRICGWMHRMVRVHRLL